MLGNLLRDIPYSEVTATLEVLACQHITREDLTRIRVAKSLAIRIADLIHHPDRTVFGFPVSMTIQLGTGGLWTAESFCVAIEAAGGLVYAGARDILGRPGFMVARKLTEVDLVVEVDEEIAGKDSPANAEVFAGAERRGWEKCPPDVGPQLRLQNMGQPEGEHLLIGMEPIRDSDGKPLGFAVVHDHDGCCLYTYLAYPDRIRRGRPWVFVLPRRVKEVV